MQSLSYIYGKIKYGEVLGIAQGPTQRENRPQNSLLLSSGHRPSFLVSLCSVCQGMTRSENILNQLVKLPVWWLFWEHLVYYHIWGSNWSFITIGGELFPRNWPSGGARRSWVKLLFSWKLHVTYLKCLVTLYEAGEEKAVPYKAPKRISNPVSSTWLLQDLPSYKPLLGTFVLSIYCRKAPLKYFHFY